MSAVREAQKLFEVIAGPVPAGTLIKTMLCNVHDATGIGLRRLRSIWNDETKAVSSTEMDALRDAARRGKQQAREAKDRADYGDICAELAALKQRLDALDAYLAGAATESLRTAGVAGSGAAGDCRVAGRARAGR